MKMQCSEARVWLFSTDRDTQAIQRKKMAEARAHVWSCQKCRHAYPAVIEEIEYLLTSLSREHLLKHLGIEELRGAALGDSQVTPAQDILVKVDRADCQEVRQWIEQFLENIHVGELLRFGHANGCPDCLNQFWQQLRVKAEARKIPLGPIRV